MNRFEQLREAIRSDPKRAARREKLVELTRISQEAQRHIVCPNGPDRETGEYPCVRGQGGACETCGFDPGVM